MQEPYCLAMVLCDAIHRDPGTGKFTILGTFSNLSAKSFPATARLAIYFAITDGEGPTVVRVQLVNAEGGAIDPCSEADDPNRLFLGQLELENLSPLMVVESHLSFEMTIPREGVYYCELFAGASPLMTRRFTATTEKKSHG